MILVCVGSNKKPNLLRTVCPGGHATARRALQAVSPLAEADYSLYCRSGATALASSALVAPATVQCSGLRSSHVGADD